MKKLILAAAIGLGAVMMASPTLAQQTPATAPAAKPAAGKISVQTTKIADLIKNEKAKAALEKALPEISGYYDQIGEMTLADVAPMSQGALDAEKLKALQAEFDKL